MLALIISFFFSLIGHGEWDQNHAAEAGSFYITQYLPETYDAHNQNWAVTQDHYGRMYFGNNNGLLIYDGNAWRLVEVAGGRVVLSLDVDDQGTLYIGSVNDFGFLASDEKGKPYYQSLRDSVPEEYRDFTDVWETLVTPDGIAFRTRSYIFLYTSDGNLEVIEARTRFERSYMIDGSLYLNELEHGLHRLEDGQLEPIPNTPDFDNNAIWGAYPRPDGSYFIATRQGIYVYESESFNRYETQVDEKLGDYLLYYGSVVPGKGIAFATIRGGLILTDFEGNIIRVYNAENGLQTPQTAYAFADRDGGLWLGTTNGIVHLEASSPLTYFDKDLGLEAGVQAITRYRNSIILATQSGVFQQMQPENPGQFARFEEYDWSLYDHMDILTTDNALLISGSMHSGLMVVYDDRTDTLFTDFDGYSLHQSAYDPERVIYGHRQGVSIAKLQNGRWQEYQNLTEDEVMTMRAVEDKHGTIWVGTHFEGVVRFRPDDSGSYQLTHFSAEDYFSSGSTVYVSLVDGEPLIHYGDGIFQISEIGDTTEFTPWRINGHRVLPEGMPVAHVVQDSDNRIWVRSGSSTYWFEPQAVSENGDHLQSGVLNRKHLRSVFGLYPEDNGIVWFGGPGGLVRFESAQPDPPQQPYYTLLRNAVLAGQDTIYGGFASENIEPPVLQHHQNALRFEFSAVFFEDSPANRYQFQLVGFDDDWLPWTSEAFKDYTNLSHGEYAFRVRSQNVYGQTGYTDQFSFTILPPWYLTNVAYFLYLLIFTGFLYQIVNWQRGLVEKKEQEKARIKDMEHRAEAAELQAKVAESQSRVLESENARRKDELMRAQEVHSYFLPQEMPHIPGYQLAAYHQSASEVGGDYFDFFPASDGAWFVSIGDATGHGLPAGLMVAITKSASVTTLLDTPSEILVRMNQAIRKIGMRKMHMALQILKIQQNTISIASAAIPTALHYRQAEKKIVALQAVGLPLGAIDKPVYEEAGYSITSGDLIVMMTDGLPESENPEGLQLGYEKVENCIANHAHESAQEMCNALQLLGEHWRDGSEPDDDITIIVLKKG